MPATQAGTITAGGLVLAEGLMAAVHTLALARSLYFKNELERTCATKHTRSCATIRGGSVIMADRADRLGLQVPRLRYVVE
jgi:hypothetical protein